MPLSRLGRSFSMAKDKSFVINADAVAAAIGQEVNDIVEDLTAKAENLTVQIHAKVLEMASNELKGFQLQQFLGEKGENVGWARVSDSLWVVEIDDSVGFYDTGRPETPMATEHWLLKNAKTAKDGSKYKVIPISQGKSSPSANAAITSMANNAIKQARTADGKRISRTRIDRNADGTPKLGVIHKIPVKAPGTQSQMPSLFSKPRGPGESQRTGLPEHGGIFKLEGLAITQRMVKGKVKREATVFRVASSKHANDRWFYPAIKAHNFLERALDWAVNEVWPKMIDEISRNK